MSEGKPHIHFRNGYWCVRRNNGKRGPVPVNVEAAYNFVDRVNHTPQAYEYREQLWCERVLAGYYRTAHAYELDNNHYTVWNL